MSETPINYRQETLNHLAKLALPTPDSNPIEAGLVRALSLTNQNSVVHFVLELPEGGDAAALKSAIHDWLMQLDWVEDVKIAVADARPSTPPDLSTGAGMAQEDAAPRIEGVEHVMLVGSGKGGVGKSTVTAGLAAEMVARGLRVGVLDADIYGPSQPRIWGVTGRPVSYNDELIPIATLGLKLMSLGLLTTPDQALVWRGPILHDTLTRLLFRVRWAPLDVLLIDLPPGTGDVPLTILQQVQADGAVMVSTPQDLSLIDLRRAMDLFRRTDTPMLGLVENMAIHICSECGAVDHPFGAGLEVFAKDEDVPFLGKLPLSHSISAVSESGMEQAGDEAKAASSAHFAPIVDQILEGMQNGKAAG